MNMKKMIALLLALAMVLCLAACGNKTDDNKGSADNDSETNVNDATTIKVGMVTDVRVATPLNAFLPTVSTVEGKAI